MGTDSKKRNFTLAATLLAFATLTSCHKKDNLTFDSYYSRKDGKFTLLSFLVNRGETTLRVAIGGIGHDTVVDSKVIIYYETSDFRSGPPANRTPDGHFVVMPESAMNITTLYPGEAATLRDDGETTIPFKVVYRISPSWGKRFNIWHGVLEAVPRPLPTPTPSPTPHL